MSHSQVCKQCVVRENMDVIIITLGDIFNVGRILYSSENGNYGVTWALGRGAARQEANVWVWGANIH